MLLYINCNKKNDKMQKQGVENTFGNNNLS